MKIKQLLLVVLLSGISQTCWAPRSRDESGGETTAGANRGVTEETRAKAAEEARRRAEEANRRKGDKGGTSTSVSGSKGGSKNSGSQEKPAKGGATGSKGGDKKAEELGRSSEKTFTSEDFDFGGPKVSQEGTKPMSIGKTIAKMFEKGQVKEAKHNVKKFLDSIAKKVGKDGKLKEKDLDSILKTFDTIDSSESSDPEIVALKVYLRIIRSGLKSPYTLAQKLKTAAKGLDDAVNVIQEIGEPYDKQYDFQSQIDVFHGAEGELRDVLSPFLARNRVIDFLEAHKAVLKNDMLKAVSETMKTNFSKAQKDLDILKTL